MYVKLTVSERIGDLRDARGLTYEELAAQTGISKSALHNYETYDGIEISQTNLEKLAKFYGVSPDYLIGRTEIKKDPNAELHELHLGDEMIELFKSGKINNRLLSEMALHPNFRRLMTDIEIYVDRIADMRIKDMNAVLAAIRQQVIQDHDPGEDDLYIRTLELAQVDEDDYFSKVIHDDLDSIIWDIREAHKTDATTADETDTAAEVQKQLQDAMNYQGTKEEKQVRAYLASLGIDYDVLTPEEVVTQINILKKSKHLKALGKKRGKYKMS